MPYKPLRQVVETPIARGGGRLARTLLVPDQPAAESGRPLFTESRTMMRIIMASLLTISLLGVPSLVGCERELSHEKKVESSPSGTTVKEKKTVENPDGSVTKTETKDNSSTP